MSENNYTLPRKWENTSFLVEVVSKYRYTFPNTSFFETKFSESMFEIFRNPIPNAMLPKMFKHGVDDNRNRSTIGIDVSVDFAFV